MQLTKRLFTAAIGATLLAGASLGFACLLYTSPSPRD